MYRFNVLNPGRGDMGREVKERVRTALLRGEPVLLVAPTGWGKTRLMLELATELARDGKRVGIFAPTLTLLVKKWPELLSLAPPSAILTAGASQHCVYKWGFPQRHCPRCKLRRAPPEGFQAPLLTTFEDIVKMVSEDVCSYWAQEYLLNNYSVILAHYGRMSKLLPLLHFVFIDEMHELYLPHMSSIPLSDIAELLGADPGELTSVAVIRELAESSLAGTSLDPAKEDKLIALLQMLKKTCWLEEGNLTCMDLYTSPSGRPILAATATPPPGFPPPGWEVAEIGAEKKPKAYVADDSFYYPEYKGAALLLWLIHRRFGDDRRIAVFATSSLRRLLEQNLPPGVELYPGLVDAWGKMRVGVDLPQYDVAVVFWPALHISARRRLRAEGRDPSITELIQGVQLAGRVLRPRPGEMRDDVLQRRVVIFADARFRRHSDYLSRYFELLDLPL